MLQSAADSPAQSAPLALPHPGRRIEHDPVDHPGRLCRGRAGVCHVLHADSHQPAHGGHRQQCGLHRLFDARRRPADAHPARAAAAAEHAAPARDAAAGAQCPPGGPLRPQPRLAAALHAAPPLCGRRDHLPAGRHRRRPVRHRVGTVPDHRARPRHGPGRGGGRARRAAPRDGAQRHADLRRAGRAPAHPL